MKILTFALVIMLSGCATMQNKKPQIEAPVFYPDKEDIQKCPMPDELLSGQFGEYVRGFNQAVELIKLCELKRSNLLEVIKKNNKLQNP